MLAHLLRTDLLPEAHMISDELPPLRDVLRTRLRLVERCVAAQNSIARLLEKYNVQDVANLDALGQLQATTHIEQAELLRRQVKWLESAPVPHLVPDADGAGSGPRAATVAHPRHRQGMCLLDPAGGRRHRPLCDRPPVFRLLPGRARRRQLG